MAQRLHLVFGGELIDPAETVFKNVDDLHIVGIFPDYQTAYAAWKADRIHSSGYLEAPCFPVQHYFHDSILSQLQGHKVLSNVEGKRSNIPCNSRFPYKNTI